MPLKITNYSVIDFFILDLLLASYNCAKINIYFLSLIGGGKREMVGPEGAGVNTHPRR